LFSFLNSTPARIVSAILLIQTALLYSSIRPEYIPTSRPLDSVPHQFGSWNMIQESQIDKDIAEVLKADDTVNRVYRNAATGSEANLFVASFRTQRNGKSPHSPKNCMPGGGWTHLSSDDYAIDAGVGAPIVVNRYVIVHGQERELVLYWYQSRERVVAEEFKAKYWVVADAIRYNRTDTALVRVIVNIVNNDEDTATKLGSDFVRAFFSTLREYLPT
jgi:EpsI family protein